MAQEFKNPKYIIVLGTTFSGSGAIFDYLNGRGDLYTPISEEYLLPILPNTSNLWSGTATLPTLGSIVAKG